MPPHPQEPFTAYICSSLKIRKKKYDSFGKRHKLADQPCMNIPSTYQLPTPHVRQTLCLCRSHCVKAYVSGYVQVEVCQCSQSSKEISVSKQGKYFNYCFALLYKMLFASAFSLVTINTLKLEPNISKNKTIN